MHTIHPRWGAVGSSNSPDYHQNVHTEVSTVNITAECSACVSSAEGGKVDVIAPPLRAAPYKATALAVHSRQVRKSNAKHKEVNLEPECRKRAVPSSGTSIHPMILSCISVYYRLSHIRDAEQHTLRTL